MNFGKRQGDECVAAELPAAALRRGTHDTVIRMFLDMSQQEREAWLGRLIERSRATLRRTDELLNGNS